MDARIEPLHIPFRNMCKNYRDDYKFFSNTHDKLASLLIEQMDVLMEKYTDPYFLNAVICCFMQAVASILEEERSKRFLKLLAQFSRNHYHNVELIDNKKRFHKEIISIKDHLKINSRKSSLSTSTQFDFQALEEKYTMYKRDLAEQIDEQQRREYRWRTAETEAFLLELVRDTPQNQLV